ncbi:MAG: methylmalonyl-CoA epimerase [Chloroflexi bacterium]|nr:MAG: methylmalonyl-CoA epimerase [Phototrophicales bacterium]RMF80749.1 MAG: methylmalonyl-CoA epimerase [Chloroflexota bacterium]
MTPIRINHVAIVVPDVAQALQFWQDALGMTVSHIERNAQEAVEIAFLPVGEGEIELIAPITDDSGVARYLAKSGAGLHHICLEVADIEASMAQIAKTGAELINESPRIRDDGIRYAFVHPKSTGGVLLELYQLPTVAKP